MPTGIAKEELPATAGRFGCRGNRTDVATLLEPVLDRRKDTESWRRRSSAHGVTLFK
jgi:hypothetical protein